MDYDNNLQNKVKHIRSFATCMRAKEELVLMADNVPIENPEGEEVALSRF